MTVEATANYLLMTWIGVLGLLLIRLLWLRIHRSYLLFTISTGMDVVFGIATAVYGLGSDNLASLGLLGDSMDLFLSPAIALELFTAVDWSAHPGRYLTPLGLALLSGGCIVAFLASNPDSDSFLSASAVAFMADLLVMLFVLSFVMRRFRGQTTPVERNTLWLRRLFAAELIISVLQSMVAPLIDAKAIPVVQCVFLVLNLLAALACLWNLRATKSAEPAAS